MLFISIIVFLDSPGAYTYGISREEAHKVSTILYKKYFHLYHGMISPDLIGCS